MAESDKNPFPHKIAKMVYPWEPVKIAERKAIAAGEIPKPPSATYDAGCHCGAIAFDVTLSPPLDQGFVVVYCNCSICRRTGNHLAYAERKDVRWKTPNGERPEHLGVYRFNSKTMDILFCKLCGCSLGVDFVSTFGEAFDGCGVSVRAINGIDLSALTYGPNDGIKTLPPAVDTSGQWYDHATGKLK